MLSDDAVRRRFGASARVSRTQGFVLVHLDDPSQAEIRRRTRGFDPDRFFEPDCPLCAIQRARRVVVFETWPQDAEEIDLD